MEHGLARRKDLVEKVLLTVGGAGATIFVIFLLWLVITDSILDKGQIVGGILRIAFILAAAVSLALVVYRRVLINATAKSSLPAPETPLPEVATRRLGERTFEPIPSVTEPTTELLRKEPSTHKNN